MSGRTKKPPTEAQGCFAFQGPITQAPAARAALQALGFVEIAPAVARDARTGRFLSPSGRRGTTTVEVIHQEVEGRVQRVLSVRERDEEAAAVPWREAFPPLDEAQRPGRMLRAARTREDLTQMQLARLTAIPQRHLSEMEHGKRTIGKERAKQLAEVLNVNYRMFL